VNLNTVVAQVTQRIQARSKSSRTAYLVRMKAALDKGPVRKGLACTNLAHAFAASNKADKLVIRELRKPSIAIVSAYNDMLSVHQPFENYPAIIKQAARDAGAVAQFAGGVPAMCDGVTQGQTGMELSLFSRDVIAMSTVVALSHNVFDAVLCLGVCDKIVPGLLMGALQFGHLPVIFVPAGPMTTGLSNDEKTKVRKLYAQGKVGREALLESEAQSYHGPGTCTFYGTANSNQMLMEVMGLHLPGAAFVTPNTPLRDALTAAAAKRVAELTHLGKHHTPVGEVVDERAVVNGIVGLLATGGSTNHTIHLVAMARAAGIQVNWDDFSDLSDVVPVLAKIYPNGSADVNHFHAAGGMGVLIRELLQHGFLHGDVKTVAGERGLWRYAEEPFLDARKLKWRAAPGQSADASVLRIFLEPFSREGGLKVLRGNLGRGVIKVSAVAAAHQVVEAPALVFDSQQALLDAFQRNELQRDFIAVVRFQGPRANGMPELHQLTPCLSVLQDQGFKVALVTDGRMSGASGKVPAAIHITPECLSGGPLAKVRNGDVIRLDAQAGILEVKLSEQELAARRLEIPDLTANQFGTGREFFGVARASAASAEEGGSFCLGLVEDPVPVKAVQSHETVTT